MDEVTKRSQIGVRTLARSGPVVSADVLLRGAWYAIEQCGLLLRDAVALHREKAYPSAVALALLAREELGRYKILLDFWRTAAKGAPLPSVAEVRAACDDHEEKQRRAQLSVVYRSEGSGELAKLLRIRAKSPPHSTEWKEAAANLERLDSIKIKRTPADRHSTRMRALYVDLNDSGNAWSRPAELPELEATNCLTDAANDYSVQAHNHLQPEILLHNDPELAAALDAWPERPALPPAIWPPPWEGGPA